MSEEQRAREALRDIGIQKPSPSLIRSWIQAEQGERELLERASALKPPPPAPRPDPLPTEPEKPRPKWPRGYSKSNLEPTLREQGTLERPHGVRKPGRPRVVANWFPAVAKTMADGAPLKDALKMHGISLDKTQVRAVYRNEELKKLRRQARNHHQRSADN